MFKRILVAHDGSDGAQHAFDVAVELAAATEASLHMISVEEDLPRHAEMVVDEVAEVKDAEDTYFGELGNQARRRAALKGVAIETRIVCGHEVKAIVEAARAGQYDLLIVGFMGHSRIYASLWGGTSQNLTRLAPCSVLVVK
jgi:nucleotide-binding universal stress UspA family protein